MVRAKCDDVIFRVRSFFRQWDDMMGFKEDSSIRHYEAGLLAQLALTHRPFEDAPAHVRTSHEDMTRDGASFSLLLRLVLN
jgi:hypothetical protein